MAVQTTKNVANYIGFPISAFGNLIAGLGAISIHAWVWATSLSTGTNDNAVLLWLINSTTVGGSLSISGGAGAAKARITGRSVNTDARGSVSGATTIATGSWVSIGGVLDFAGDAVRVYLNGVQDGSAAVTFANATYTQGVPTSGDSIGGIYLPTPATADQFDGNIAEVSIYAGDIGADGFLSLGKAYDARNVLPGLLAELFPLFGPADIKGRLAELTGTITGSIPQSTVDPGHPRIIRA
jgi:hypothetical protein